MYCSSFYTLHEIGPAGNASCVVGSNSRCGSVLSRAAARCVAAPASSWRPMRDGTPPSRAVHDGMAHAPCDVRSETAPCIVHTTSDYSSPGDTSSKPAPVACKTQPKRARAVKGGADIHCWPGLRWWSVLLHAYHRCRQSMLSWSLRGPSALA